MGILSFPVEGCGGVVKAVIGRVSLCPRGLRGGEGGV